MTLWPERGVSIQFERRHGLLLQLYFLRHLLPARPKVFRYAWRLVSEGANGLFWPLNRFPGFCLTAVAVKSAYESTGLEPSRGTAGTLTIDAGHHSGAG